MISTRKRGRMTELEFKKILESKGYKCILAPLGNRFSRNNDLFGYWDIVAYIPNSDSNWLCVQVKTNQCNNKKEYIESAKDLPKTTGAWLVIRKGKDDWKIINLRD